MVQDLWSKRLETDKILENAKNALEGIYIQGDKEIRDCIINAVLEHIFEDKEMSSSFKDWQKQSPLDKAYKLALEW